MCVELTPAAAKFMERMVRLSAGGPGAGFRLSVTPGGCSGFDSRFSVESQPLAGDTVMETQGVRLFMPQDSCALLRGYTIDFRENRLESGLVLSKPGAPQGCGCGQGQAKVAFFRPGGGCSKAG